MLLSDDHAKLCELSDIDRGSKLAMTIKINDKERTLNHLSCNIINGSFQMQFFKFRKKF